MTIANVGVDKVAVQYQVQDLEPGRTAAGAPAAPVSVVDRLRQAAAGLGVGGSASPVQQAAIGYVPRAGSFAPAARGYAVKASSPKAATKATTSTTSKPATSTKTTSATAKASTSKSSSSASSQPATTSFTAAELTFLKDKKLSIEEKLFRFMTLLVQKGDQQLLDAMNAYAGKATSSSGTSSAKTSSSSSGSTSTKAGGSSASGSDVKAVAEAVAKQVGGPILAAAASALGVPQLAPVALQVGGTVGEVLVDVGAAAVDALGSIFGGGGNLEDVVAAATRPRTMGVAPAPERPAAAAPAPATGAATSTGSSGTSTGSGGTSSTAGGSEMDEKLVMLNLQRLVEKQNAMFSALSNVLKAMHDGQMTAVQNIR